GIGLVAAVVGARGSGASASPPGRVPLPAPRSLAVDLDGDGRPDQIRLDAAGRLTVVTARRTATAMLATPPSVARLELVVEAGRGPGPDPLILALAEGPGRIRRALAAAFRPGGRKPLWPGDTRPRPVGPVRR